MLVGKSGSGKTTLTQALLGGEIRYRKTQAMEYCGEILDTPGEYLENRRYYSALIASSGDCDTVAFVQDATDGHTLFPPLFAALFERRVIGVVSKIDSPDADVERARRFLEEAGICEVILASATCNVGLERLKAYLKPREA